MEYGKKRRLGNFTAIKKKVNGRSYVEFSTISGSWSVRYGESTGIYPVIDMMTEEDWEKMGSSIGMFILSVYAVGEIIDAGVTSGVLDIVGKYLDSVKAPEADKKEDDEILAEEERLHDLSLKSEEEVRKESPRKNLKGKRS